MIRLFPLGPVRHCFSRVPRWQPASGQTPGNAAVNHKKNDPPPKLAVPSSGRSGGGGSYQIVRISYQSIPRSGTPSASCAQAKNGALVAGDGVPRRWGFGGGLAPADRSGRRVRARRRRDVRRWPQRWPASAGSEGASTGEAAGWSALARWSSNTCGELGELVGAQSFERRTASSCARPHCQLWCFHHESNPPNPGGSNTRKATVWTALATAVVFATVAAGLPENDGETAPDGILSADEGECASTGGTATDGILSADEGESGSTGGTATPLPVQEPDCTFWEDWCKMRFWFFCQKWHLSSTPGFPSEDDGDNWEPEDILRATGEPHGLERGWTLDDHHNECPW